MTETEIAQMLAEIFPPKPEPVSSELPAELSLVVEAAKTLGLSWVPAIIIKTTPCGCKHGAYDINMTYASPAIVIYSVLDYGFGNIVHRSIPQMARTLAHELGHVIHGGTYEVEGFAACEDAADSYRDQILAIVGGITNRNL